MNLILMILAAVVVAVLLAIVIVKFVPLKLRPLVSILLLAVSVYLGYLIYNGVMEPIRFNIEKKVRYAKVIERLKLIRKAELKYKEAKGVYTKSQDKLINFIENDSLVLTETVNYTEMEKRGAIEVEVSKKRIDTTGREPVLKYFKQDDYTKMFKVPGSDKDFEIKTSEIEKIPGLFVPVFEVKTDKKSILKDLAPHLVKQELEAVEADQIKGANISVGSLEEVSTGGNWPPFYDNPNAKINTKK